METRRDDDVRIRDEDDLDLQRADLERDRDRADLEGDPDASRYAEVQFGRDRGSTGRASTADLVDAGSTGEPDDVRRRTGDDARDDDRRPLLPDEDLRRYRERWDTVQVGFVDEPRGSVQEADALVAELMQHLARTFADERGQLERQWERGTDVSTEDLRVALQRYRSFFDRLLAA